ncbi:MAG: T9SS type A sorting domain-containing protein [Candidatus Hatepunaea meridiana]|nr:T9SS type A sorting domain-containing protein [Candidatus Hatepunaea meridiana]
MKSKKLDMQKSNLTPIKALLRGISVLFIMALPFSLVAQTEVEGEVSGEWTADDSPYIVMDSTWVPEDERLTLREGVEVLFEEGQGLYIYGTLNASGTERDSVRIRVAEDVEHWRGLRFYGRNRTEWNYASIICPDIAFILDSGCLLTMNNCLVDVYRMAAKENDSGVESCNLTFSQSNIRLRNRFGTTGGILSASHTRFDFSEDEQERPGFWSSGTGYRLTSCEVIGELHPSFGSSIVESCRFLRLPNGELSGVAILGSQGRIRNSYVEGSVSLGQGYGHLIRCVNNIILGGLHFSDCNAEISDCEVMGAMQARECESVVMRNSILSRQFYITDVESMIIDSCFFVNGEQGIGFSDHGGDNPHRTITRSVFFTKIDFGYRRVATEGLFDHNTVFFDSAGFRALGTSLEIVFTNNIIVSVIPGHKLFSQYELPVFEYNCVYGFEYAGGPSYDLIPIDAIDSTNIIANPLIEWNGIIPNISSNSPCRDAGDPEFDLDPDSTRTDIGVRFFDQRHYAPGLVGNLPVSQQLTGVYPNPFNSMTNITFNLQDDNHIKLTIHDLQGREVSLLHEGQETAGVHSLSWDASGLASGVYICRLQSDSKAATIKLMMVR